MSTKVENAKLALTHIFNKLGIQKVVCVDDAYADDASDEKIVEACRALIASPGLKHVEGLQGIPFENNQDAGAPWEAPLRARLNDTLETDKDRIYKKLEDMRGNQDIPTAGILDDILHGHLFEKLSPEQWGNRSAALIANAQTVRTMFLFDRCLDKDNHADTGGEELLRSFLGSDTADSPCGILSHTVEIEDEVVAWQTYATQNQIDTKRFVFISKKRLSQAPISMPAILRVMLLNAEFELVRTQFLNVLGAANQAARDKIASFNVYQIEQLIFNSTRDETAWEPDNFLRLHWIYQRANALTTLRLDASVRKASSVIKSVRSKFRFHVVDEEIRKVFRMENYEVGDSINRVFSPIELGDIFEVEGIPNRKFILVAPSCDLIIRPEEGKREGESDLTMVLEVFKDSGKGIDANRIDKVYELETLVDGEKDSWYVDFKKAHYLSFRILDSCAFNTDGQCEIRWVAPPPDELLPVWKERHAFISSSLTAFAAAFGGIQDAGMKVLALKGEFSLPSELALQVQTDLGNSKINFGVKRTMRLRFPKSQEMLIKYSQFQSRMALEADFTRNEGETHVAPIDGDAA